MLDANLKTQLKGYLERLTLPVELVASLDDSAKSAELKELLQEIASLSDKVTFAEADEDMRKPSFAIVRPGTDISVRWAMNSPRWCWRCCRSAATPARKRRTRSSA